MGRDVLLLYMSPKNPKYTTQTNEGAVRYLIKEKETPDCILALCSETVRKKAVVEMPDGSTCTTLEYFRDALRRVGIPAERLVVIEVPDSMDDEKKQFQAISQLLDKIEKEDTLSIDLSGGMRDTAMLLVTAARCMRDLRGVQTRRVIYAELRGEEPVAHDRTQLYDLFDFVTAMDAFFSTGTAQKLKSYLWSEGEKDPVLHTLLTRINQFSEDLALCRVQKLNDDLNQIAQALKETPKKSQNLTDLFFRLLKDRFSTEFAELLSSGEKALPALVSWCADHGMYQQALTLLCEQMPGICLPAYFCAAHRKRLGLSGSADAEQRQAVGVPTVPLPFLPVDAVAAGKSLYSRSAPDPQPGRCRRQYAVRRSK